MLSADGHAAIRERQDACGIDRVGRQQGERFQLIDTLGQFHNEWPQTGVVIAAEQFMDRASVGWIGAVEQHTAGDHGSILPSIEVANFGLLAESEGSECRAFRWRRSDFHLGAFVGGVACGGMTGHSVISA